MTAGSLLAAGFIHPALLGGLGLTAVPIIIHLLSRRHHRRLPWAATLFLLEAERETRRRVRFEQWLLVALRCIAMGLLALLFTRPFLRPGLVASLLGERTRVQRVIVVDDSASLNYRVGTELEFDRLRSAASRLLSWLHQEAPDDPVTLLRASAPDEPLASAERLSDAALLELRSRVNTMGPGNVPANPREVLQRVAGQLEPLGQTVRADVYVLSDFQRAEWTAAARMSAESVFEPLRQLDSRGVRLVLIASGVPRRSNVALRDVHIDRGRAIAAMPAVVVATVAEFGERMSGEPELHVEIDGEPVPAVAAKAQPRPSEAAPDAAAEIGRRVHRMTFELTFPDGGYRVLTVGTGSVDGYPLDDTYRLAVPVPTELRVLVVDGQPATDPQRDEVYLLRNALAPPGPLSSGIRVDVVDVDGIEASEPTAYDCVLLCNVPAPGQAAVGMLERYVRRGGGLVLFLGEQVGDPDEYNREFYLDGAGVLPLPLGARITADPLSSGYAMVRTEPHPVTAMFPAAGEVLSEQVRFRRFYTVVEDQRKEQGDGAAAVLARYDDPGRTPAVIERRVGRGRVLLFTSTVDLDWNDWARAIDGSYVVTLLELIQYVARRDEHPPAFVAGERLRLPIWPDEYDLGGVFRPPLVAVQADGAANPVQAIVREAGTAADAPVVLEGPIAAQLATYEIELETRGGQAEVRPLCVNLDPRESDLATATDGELRSALGGLPYELVPAAEDFLRGDEQTRRELWPTLLVALIGVLMLEQALARWFGART